MSKDIIQGNKAIMFFDGAENTKIDIMGKPAKAIKYKESYYPESNLPKFNEDWNLLMPVVEKINEFGVWTIRPGYVCIESDKGELRKEKQFNFHTSTMDWETEDDEPIEFIFLVYSIVTKFITWYNSQSKQ